MMHPFERVFVARQARSRIAFEPAGKNAVYENSNGVVQVVHWLPFSGTLFLFARTG
jgi:hypothetical protein